MKNDFNEMTAARELIENKVEAITEEEAREAHLHPRMLAEELLYADLRNLVAAGGTGKTSLELFEAVMGALGLPIWGRKVPKPFNTAFVTKEDTREILVARLHKILEAMQASDEQRAEVWRRVWIVDLTGKPFRLSKEDGRALGPDTVNLLALAGHLEGKVVPDRIVFDPLISFTHGEGNVNDSEQAIVEAARYLMRLWQGAMVEVVHHTGKANARTGSTDQYAGRNGSALPDGSRMVAVLVTCSVEDFYAATGVRLSTEDGERGLRLALPKISYAPPQPDIYIRRKGFWFEMMPTLSQEAQAELEVERKLLKQAGAEQNTRDSIIAALQACAYSDDPFERYPARSAVCDLPGVEGARKSRAAALKELLEEGVVEEVKLTQEQVAEFPSPQSLGGRKTYLRLVDD